MLKKGKTYEEVYRSFLWKVPRFYNIGVDCCDKWAGQRYRLALIYEDDQGRVEKYTFWDLSRLSNRLANALRASGLDRGSGWGSCCRNARRRPCLIWPFTRSGASPYPSLPFSARRPWNTVWATAAPGR